MNKQVALKLRRRILAFVMAFVLVMTSIVTIPEFSMTAKAAGTISYGVIITGGTGAEVGEFQFNLVYSDRIVPYDNTKQIRLQCDPITDDTLRFKQWNVQVQYDVTINNKKRVLGSYSEVIKNNVFNGADQFKLDRIGSAALEQALGGDGIITCTISISAEIESKYAAISFDGNGATAGTMAGASLEKGTSYTLPECSFAKDNYKFSGWKLDESVYQPGDSVTITDDATFTAHWEPLYSVTLSANPSGYGYVYGDGKFVAGETVTVRATPTLSSKLFCNWTANGEVVSTDEEYSFKVSGDIKLVANFANKCIISFAEHGGSGSMEDIFVASGTSYTLPECGFGAPEGRYFSKWNKGKPGDVITVTGDTVLIPVWGSLEYSVSLSVNSDELGTVSGAGSFTMGNSVVVTASPAPGCEFVRWEEAGEEVSTDDSYAFGMPARDVALKAVFQRVAYPVRFEKNDGSGSTSDDWASIGGTYTIPSPVFTSPDHYEFDGWRCVMGGVSLGILHPDDEITVTAETTLYAQWKPETYDIYTIIGAPGGTTEGSDKSGIYGTEATVIATPNEHYHFVAWKDKRHGYAVVSTNPAYTFTVEGWVELAAYFEVDSYSISFDANGGGGSMLSASVEYNGSYTLPECGFTAPDGKEFAWWESDGKNYKPGDYIYNVTAPLTVTAVWLDSIEPIAITTANFPDEKFREALADFDDGDGFFTAVEIATITGMNLISCEIKDLTGIAYFTELKQLLCSNNELTSLDVSALENLETLSCENGAFTQLDLKENKNLKYLDLGGCQSLTSLDLSKCTELEEVDLSTCEALTSLDLSHNMKIKVLKLRYDDMTSIDLTGHDKLEELDCFCCSKATNFVLTGCTALKKLNAGCMYVLTQLDLTGLSALEELRVDSMNAMASMTISGVSSLKKLDLGGSRVLESLTLSNLPNLEELDFSETKLTSVDISGLPKLKKLAITSNEQLTSINFGSLATQLEFLDCSYDKALNLNFASFTNLETLYCTGCNLERLDVHKLTKLKNLTCRSNKFTQINIDGLADLAFVDCRYNPNLTSLDISSSPALVAEPDRLVYRDSGVTLITDQLYDGDLKITNVSLVLQDNLAINFIAPKEPFDTGGYGTPYAVFNVNGNEKTVQGKLDGSNYVFTCNNIAPQMIGDKIGITVYAMKGEQKVKGGA
ncbi:MAG: InlB B-repeat-containing protein, partial [Lachnospiraceae bacterium]|nr:InlB B-repeat-containing protein [Lachnospiraceae bacterium]